jgi:hypothetical protein
MGERQIKTETELQDYNKGQIGLIVNGKKYK